MSSQVLSPRPWGGEEAPHPDHQREDGDPRWDCRGPAGRPRRRLQASASVGVLVFAPGTSGLSSCCWPQGTCWKLRVVASSPEHSSSVPDTPGVSLSPGPQPATHRGDGAPHPHSDARPRALGRPWGHQGHGLGTSPPPYSTLGQRDFTGIFLRGQDTDLGHRPPASGAHRADATTQMSFNLHDKVAPLLQADRMPLGAISENYLNNVMS